MEITVDSDGKVGSLIETACRLFQSGDFPQSIEILEEALALEFDNEEVVFALKCGNFWKDKSARLSEEDDCVGQGECLLKNWKNFLIFLERLEETFENCLYPVRQYVFTTALSYFRNAVDRQGNSDTRLLLNIGRCLKGLGNYEQALEYFETCNHQKGDDPEIMSELADCYAFIGETKAAKVFFREALFIDPQKIDLYYLESLLIVRLINRLKEMGYSSPEIEEWLPVYGVLLGVFNVKRELKPLEYARLKQGVFNLEAEYEGEKVEKPFLHPRLLNKYFWLIDHYISSKEHHDKVEEVLEKIKKLDTTIYEHYIQ